LQPHPSINVVLAEDDDDHYFLIRKIWQDSMKHVDLKRVGDGEELMEYLLHRGRYAGKPAPTPPKLIILDINMPRKDGWEALAEIKSNEALRHIPVVIMTTSDTEEDKFRSYDLGASSYIRKPVELKNWVETFDIINRYWFEVADLPEALKIS
jgi:CheY-like chemotaxis protein